MSDVALTAAALLPGIWRTHDELEETLTEARRLIGEDASLLADRGLARALDQAWDAHDLLERATLELHACVPPKALAALMKKAA